MHSLYISFAGLSRFEQNRRDVMERDRRKGGKRVLISFLFLKSRQNVSDADSSNFGIGEP